MSDPDPKSVPDIRFEQPCDEPWDAMRPDGRTRHCANCDKAVHDLSLYTPEEVDALLAPGEPRACISAWIAPDGRVATRPSRTGRILTATAALPISLMPLAAAACPPGMGAISGSIEGPRGEATSVTLSATGKRRQTQTVGRDGRYQFADLTPGHYRLRFHRTGKPDWSVADVTVHADFETIRNVRDPTSPAVTVPVPIMIRTAGVPVPPPLKSTPPPPSPPAGPDAAKPGGTPPSLPGTS